MNRSINNSPWTKDEDRIALAMKVAGSTNDEIGERFSRSGDSVRNRLRWISLPIEERQRISRSRNGTKVLTTEYVLRHEPPQMAIDDRNRRAAAIRSLTSEFFGDPEPGRSALCKKESASCTA